MNPIHLLPLIFLLAASCSSNINTLRLESLDQKRQFSQAFTQAYLAKNDSGDDDIVLVQDDIQPRHADPNKPLTPDPGVMPRQMVHIRVFWTPMAGVKADHPANTNASIHWCFICQNGPQPGIIEYTGSGLVIVDKTSTGATVTIRKAWMKQGCMRGQLCDPIGPCILKGTFRATHDPDQVRAVIAEIKAVSNSNEEAQASSPIPVN